MRSISSDKTGTARFCARVPEVCLRARFFARRWSCRAAEPPCRRTVRLRCDWIVEVAAEDVLRVVGCLHLLQSRVLCTVRVAQQLFALLDEAREVEIRPTQRERARLVDELARPRDVGGIGPPHPPSWTRPRAGTAHRASRTHCLRPARSASP